MENIKKRETPRKRFLSLIITQTNKKRKEKIKYEEKS